MSRDRCEVNWIDEAAGGDPVTGQVRWDPVHSLWNGGMLLLAVVLVPSQTTLGAVLVGALLTGAMLLLGHSVGFHRLLIHGSFETTPGLRRFLVSCGTVAGMSGPLWIVRTHDLRDWAQRQPECHDYLAHRRAMLHDAWWQLHCRLQIESPPRYQLASLEQDKFIVWLERTWMFHQVPVAGILWLFGGWPFVVWGVFVRITLTVHGHWFIGHLAHRRGPQTWLVKDAGVQAHDVPWAGLVTMGEAWHNNHHAYPGSAKIGLKPGQSDWGYGFVRLLEKAGLAWNICLPTLMPARASKLTDAERPTSPPARSAPPPRRGRAGSAW